MTAKAALKAALPEAAAVPRAVIFRIPREHFAGQKAKDQYGRQEPRRGKPHLIHSGIEMRREPNVRDLGLLA